MPDTELERKSPMWVSE